MGGTNVHVVVEEAPVHSTTPVALPVQVLPLSASTPAALQRLAGRLAARIEGRRDLAVAGGRLDPAIRSPRFAAPLVRRRPNVAEAVERLSEAAAASATQTADPVFLFPGQGAQHAGMAVELARYLPAFRAPLDEACDGLAALGVDLRPLLEANRDDPEANRRLMATELAQPALFAVGYALARLFQSWGIQPSACLGHSVGEYAAACIAGVVDLKSALRLVVARGLIMQALPPGDMLSVRLDEADLRPLLPSGVEIAALNAPGLTVIAGPADAIATAAAAIKAAGGLSRPLRTSHAFHSAMMEPALEPFMDALRDTELHPPAIPMASNLTGAWLDDAQAVDPAFWARQVRAPVRFSDGVATLLEAGHCCFLELGPGSGLGTLVLRQGRADTTVMATLAPVQEDDDLETALQALGRLWSLGAAPDWRTLWPDGTPQRIPLPPYPFERVRHWIDAPGATAATPVAAEIEDEPVPDVATGETAVIALWQRHLGHDVIDPDDDYHVLGGDSLLAVRLVADLNRRFGADLQPHDLLTYATPRRLARRLDQGGDQMAAPFARVMLREGKPGNLPLVLFHAVGGTVNFYQDLATALDPAMPVVAFQSKALSGGVVADLSVEAMTSDYLAALAPVQPRGPYRLAGSSFGGMLAFEAARQLIAAGEQVELLAMMDTPGPGDLPREMADDAELLSYIARLLGRPMASDDLRTLAPRDQLERFVAALAERLPSGMTADEFAVYLDVFKSNTAAMRAYKPEPGGHVPKILFFKARERDADTPAEPECAWQNTARPRCAGGHGGRGIPSIHDGR